MVLTCFLHPSRHRSAPRTDSTVVPPETSAPLRMVGVSAGTARAPTSAWEQTAPAGILTAKLLEVGLQLLAGAEEEPSLLGAQHEGALLVDGDAGHLRVQLGERRALRGGTRSERLRRQPLLFYSGIFFLPIKRFPHEK